MTGASALFIVDFFSTWSTACNLLKKKKINECVNDGINGLTCFMDSWIFLHA